MTLYSAAEDFAVKSLSSVPGTLAKLRYVSELRREDGQYEHWGLLRIYGERAVQLAIEETHRELVLQILRMPLRELLADARQCAEHQQTDVREYVRRLYVDADKLIPGDLGGGSARHFSTVLQSVSSLIQACKDASRLVS
jgi:hypothetical protein